MRWINGYDWETAWEKKCQLRKRWHRWFAWYPVVVGYTGGRRQKKAWLEDVLRSGEPAFTFEGAVYWDYKYKELN
jgi:hypothetical protein